MGISYVALIVITLVVCIPLAPIFSSEYQTGADAILLSTKYGRSKLIIAKIASAFLLTGHFINIRWHEVNGGHHG